MELVFSSAWFVYKLPASAGGLSFYRVAQPSTNEFHLIASVAYAAFTQDVGISRDRYFR